MPNLRWLLLNFTDPRFDLTREQKHEIRQRARRIRFFNRPIFMAGTPLSSEVQQAKLRRRSWLARFAGRLPLFALYLLWLAFAILLPMQFRQAPWPVVASAVSVTVAVLWTMTCWTGYVLARPWYRYAMYELGYEICAECGYPLFGLDESTHCPECGWRKTHRDDPPLVEWTDADRQTLREHGYEPCAACGGLMMMRDQKCPRCGESHATASPT